MYTCGKRKEMSDNEAGTYRMEKRVFTVALDHKRVASSLLPLVGEAAGG